MIGYLITAVLVAMATAAGLALFWMWQGADRFRPARPAPAPVVDHGPDPLTGWEKAAVLTTGAASAVNVLLWALGVDLAEALPGWTPLGVIRVLFAVVSFVSLDLVAVTTVMAMRAGRRGLWSELSAAAAALVAALIALDVAGVELGSWGWGWLHAGPALVLYAFIRHLATPKAGRRAEDLAAELETARAERDEATRERTDQQQEAARGWATVKELRAELADAQAAAGQAQALADHWQGMAAQAAHRPALTADQAETVNLGGRAVPVRRLVAELDSAGHRVPRSTLLRAAERAAGQEG